MLIAVSGILGAAIWMQRQRAEMEAAAGAAVNSYAIIDKARQRMRSPTEGRRRKAIELLESLADPLKKAFGENKEKILFEARSVYAAALGVPDLTDEVGEIGGEWPHVWNVAMHPDGKYMAIATHIGPIRWDRGTKLEPPKEFDKKNARNVRAWFSLLTASTWHSCLCPAALSFGTVQMSKRQLGSDGIRIHSPRNLSRWIRQHRQDHVRVLFRRQGPFVDSAGIGTSIVDFDCSKANGCRIQSNRDENRSGNRVPCY